MNSIDKMAKKDAERYLLAEMFYGPGAGTRRKLLDAELDSKFKMPGYNEAFEAAYKSLDQNKFAMIAIKERKALDRSAKATRNLNALRTGRHQNLTNGALVVVTGAILLHKTGYDAVIVDEAKRLYKKGKLELEHQKLKRRNRSVAKDQQERFHI